MCSCYAAASCIVLQCFLVLCLLLCGRIIILPNSDWGGTYTAHAVMALMLCCFLCRSSMLCCSMFAAMWQNNNSAQQGLGRYIYRPRCDGTATRKAMKRIRQSALQEVIALNFGS